MNKATRDDVIAAIDTEREYQDLKWNQERPPTPVEYAVFMRDYVEEVLHYASRHSTDDADQHVLDNIRKVVAMGVHCMEQHGAPNRSLGERNGLRYQNELRDLETQLASIRKTSAKLLDTGPIDGPELADHIRDLERRARALRGALPGLGLGATP